MSNLLAAVHAWIGDHKKFTMAVVTGLVALVPQSIIPNDRREWVCGALMTFILAQGVADHGKEAAKINAGQRADRRTPPPTPIG